MRQRQKGFTLIEVVLAVGIAGVVVATIAMTITTLLMNSQQPTTQQVLLQQVKSAGYQLTRDIQMSSNVTLSAPNGFPFTINIPVDQVENNDYTVDYRFDGNTLKRQQFDSSANLTAESMIAQYVDINNTTCGNITEGLYKLAIRVSMGEEVVMASYEMKQRLILD